MATMRQPLNTTPALIVLPVMLITLGLALAGCNGAFIGNFFVLGVTIAIFFGTLSLGRTAEATRTARSTADSSRSVRPAGAKGSAAAVTQEGDTGALS